MQRVRVIDSHTEGEPTRVVVAGAPVPPGRTVVERAKALANEFDWFRRAVVLEPRGSDILVGALLVPPDSAESTAGVVYFNNAGVLGMCGHGTIGVVRTLAHMARLEPGAVRLDTPVGPVVAVLRDDLKVEVHNVRAFVERLDIPLTLDDGRVVHGDVAYGGNGFLLCSDHGIPVDLEHLPQLQSVAQQMRRALHAAGLATIAGRAVDHVELFAPPHDAANDSRNYVYCPGGAYDRSPCGTGTCAKLACLAARGELAAGQRWRQESIIGSVFEAWYETAPEGGVLPVIAGRAWITAETELVFEDDDPYKSGI